jgi:eukaryotic-like serine/threonine-protein kinase
MNDEQWSRLLALFDSVHEMKEDARKAFLDRELRDEPELRAEIDSLFACAAPAADFLYARAPAEKGDGGMSPGAGSSIGPYQLIDLLGEGGFGVVYLAEQLRPIRRRVALKLIKPGMDTKQVIARFEAERQTLALMNHPGIAHVFDAGETEQGRPYFAMEFVPGSPITAFCDQERLRVRERLDLFLMVCDAVQHAHQKGVIHRDIKPSNILVARRDGVPQLKIIDFGIVKATSATMDDRLFATREGTTLGTLGYMSPEQTGAIDAAVDTRSDIYSLGVLLYELLAGAMPFDRAHLRQVSWSEAVRILREEDPPGLSARLARTGGEPLAEIARLRSVDARTLLREVRGELEWITLRALERKPDDRYASASELAADVRRHQGHETVLARPPGTLYRMRKFARRHRVGVVTATLVLASIIGGVIAAGIGFTKARREADSARRVADFLVELFETPTPDRSLGETVTARTLLDIGARRIREEGIQDPIIRARLLSTLGQAHAKLGLHDEGLELLRDAAEATRDAAGPRSREYGVELSYLADEMRMAGKLEGIDSVIESSIAILSEAPSADRSALAWALQRKCEWLHMDGKTAQADSLIRVAIAMLESSPKPDTAALVSSYTTKGNIAGARAALREQEQDYLRALSLASGSQAERPSRVLLLHRNLARLYVNLREPEEANRHAEEAVRLARAMFPPEHPSVGLALGARGDALRSERKWNEAAIAHEEALKILRASYRGDHPTLATELLVLSSIYQNAGDLDLAIERTRECCDMRSRLHGPESPRTADVLVILARLLVAAGETVAGDSVYRAAIPHVDHARPHAVAYAYMGYANVCRDRGRMIEAETLYTRAEALLDTTAAPFQRIYYGECLADHAYLRSMRGQHGEAESMMQTAIAIQLREDAEDSPDMVGGFLVWAATRARAGNADGAIEALRRAVRCGATTKLVAGYPELIALRSRPDFPPELRK